MKNNSLPTTHQPLLSVVWATRNEEDNIGRSIGSVKSISNDLIVVDEYSTDKTVEIAKSFGAKVFKEPHHDIFHITKQKAIDKAQGEWILQLDADEVVTKELALEILEVVTGSHIVVTDKLFERHQKLIEERDGKIGSSDGEITAYFIPRLNMFLGKPLRYAGVYPDPAIRLIKKGGAYLPAKSVHEIMKVNGKIGWLKSYMLHYDSPTMKRYLARLNRYTDLKAQELADSNLPKNIISFFRFTIYHPLYTFLSLYFRHKGFLDGPNGFLWSFFSALHYPISYFKYITSDLK